MASRILIVDDEVSTLRAWAKALRYAQHRVITASSATEALTACDEHAFDLVIVDYLMPSMTGVELLSRIRKKLPLVRAIVISGRLEGAVSEDDLRETIREAVEADYYLHKPVSNERLMKAVEDLIHRPASVDWKEIADRAVRARATKIKAAKSVEKKLKPHLKRD
jgi:CheY-like chemotaxis protein